jgi:predicted nucleic acid-binding protein
MKTSDRSPFALDANIILRYLIQDGGTLADKAAVILGAVEDGEIVGCLDPVTLAEVVWVLTSYYGQDPAKVSQALLPLVKAEGIALDGRDRYVRALELFAGGGIHFGDACACSLAIGECGGRLLSFDRKLSRLDGITRSETVAPAKSR